MKEDYQYYRIEKRLDDIEELLGEVLRRLGELNYDGQVEFSDPYNVGKSKKTVSVSLIRNKKND